MKRSARTSLWLCLGALVVGISGPALSAEFKGLTTSSPLFGESSIGNTEVVVKTVTGTLDDKQRKLFYKDDIYHNELIQTFEESATEIIFLDETTLSLGPNSLITLDRFVYDPSQNAGTFVTTITEGAFRFASGKLASDSYKIRTPVATIGIRGTLIEVFVGRTIDEQGLPATTVNLNVIEGEAVFMSCDGQVRHVAAGSSAKVSMSHYSCPNVRADLQ